MAESTTLTRKDLYDQVWTDPVYKVGERYGLSGPGLAKLCARYRIPTPDRGYWTKKEFGKRTRRKPLPKASAELDTVVISKTARGADSADKSGTPSEPPIPIPDRVRITHPLVKKSKQLPKEKAAGGRGGILEPPKGCLNIQVSRKQLRRALRIMQVLVKALEAKGWEVEVRGSSTKVSVDGEWVSFGIEERRKQVMKPSSWNPEYSFREYVPSGRLALKIREYGDGHRCTWSDGSKQRVENCLASFVRGLRAIAPFLRERRLKWEERRHEREEKARRREEERKRVSDLTYWSEHWHKAQQLREFVAAAREELTRRHGEELTEHWREWLSWADDYVDRQDPLVLGRKSDSDQRDR